jgi:uncharacterized protein (DUF2147 family)
MEEEWMMRRLVLVPFLIALPSLAQAAAEGPQAQIMGEWQRGDGQARVRIAPCGKALCAINTWIRDPASSEKVGDRLVMSVSPVDDATMKGKAYDPQRKLTFNVTIAVASRQRMTTNGCLLGGFLCKSVAWARLD